MINISIHHIVSPTVGRQGWSGRLGLGAKPGRYDPGEGMSPEAEGTGKRNQTRRKEVLNYKN